MPADTLIPNAIVLTNWVTQTNTVSAWNDPQLLVTGLGAALTFGTAFIMWLSLKEMKKQYNSTIKGMEKQYNSTIEALDITDMANVMEVWKDYQKIYSKINDIDCKIKKNHLSEKSKMYLELLIFFEQACTFYFHMWDFLEDADKEISKDNLISSGKLFNDLFNEPLKYFFDNNFPKLVEDDKAKVKIYKFPKLTEYIKKVLNISLPKELQKGRPQ